MTHSIFRAIAASLLGACLAIPFAAYGAAPVAAIQAVLAKPSLLCGRFDQSKTLVGMKKPLAAEGRFCVVSGKGVLWRTLKPFPNTLRLTKDEIVHMQGGRVAMRLDAKTEPTVRMINSVLFSLLAGDLSQLETLFVVDGTLDNGNWNVTLKAREAALAKAIGTIKLDGASFVKHIAIEEASGDRTAITFSSIATGDSAMTAEEAALF